MDTRTKKTIEDSVCDFLQVTGHDLEVLFKKAYSFEYDLVESKLSDFIYDHLPEQKLDEILFFHLSRRLVNEQDSFIGNNLYDLLLTQNAVSDFLYNHQVEFKMGEDHLDLYHQGKLETFERVHGGNVSNVKWRMGYFKGREDYCFNGFALKDVLYKNSYARSLYCGPEFINQLTQVIGRADIMSDYIKESKYFCLEYKIPMDRVVFDGFDELSISDKNINLLKTLMKRLYEYSVTNINYIYDHDNLVLRLMDDDTMIEKYFLSKEEIDANMLK